MLWDGHSHWQKKSRIVIRLHAPSTTHKAHLSNFHATSPAASDTMATIGSHTQLEASANHANHAMICISPPR